jgi:7-carboxy-7-deazaguanine synthase
VSTRIESAPLFEIFSSAQGEGLLVGVRQLFVRVRGCDISCRYCDQPQARRLSGGCRLERVPGSGEFELLDNPIQAYDCIALLKQLERDCGAWHHSVAITGGEPLLYPDFVGALARLAHDAGWDVYLETGGYLPERLSQVIDDLDWVAMDVKLPSTLDTEIPMARFASFLDLASQRRAMLKMVVTGAVQFDEVEEVCRQLAGVNPTVPLVIQPVTALDKRVRPVAATALLELQTVCQQHFNDVRIIPQCHRLVGVL